MLEKVTRNRSRPSWAAFRFSAILLVGGALIGGLLGVNLASGLRFEDAMIVLRYGRNLVDGLGFVFNPGERVLGVTTPLQTLLSASMVALSRASAPVLQNWLGVGFLILQSWMVGLIVRREAGELGGALAALLVLANLNLSLLYVGMEVHLFAFLVLVVHWLNLDQRARRDLWLGGVLGLAFLTRYDAALLAACVGVWKWWHEGRFPLRMTAVFGLVVAPWLLFAQLYFGSIVPNTLAAKQGYIGPIGYLHHVAVYYKRTLEALVGVYSASETVRDHLAWFLPLVVLVGVLVMVRRNRRHATSFAFVLLLVVGYGTIGADPAFTWHYYPVNPMLFAALAVGASWIVSRTLRIEWFARWSKGAKRTLTAALLLAVTLPVAFRVWQTAQHRYVLDPHTRDLYSVAAWLDQNYGPETSLLHPSIGVIGYQTDLRIIDQAGLVTKGLFYLDGSRFTPTADVLTKHQPDLVLAWQGAHDELEDYGFEVVWSFAGHNTYVVWEKKRQVRESATADHSREAG